MNKIIAFVIIMLAGCSGASAQIPSLDSLVPSGDPTAAGRIIQLIAVVTVLSVAPGLLIMVTCFTRFVIALSFLRAGLGLHLWAGERYVLDGRLREVAQRSA